jgi:hypothetical protein
MPHFQLSTRASDRRQISIFWDDWLSSFLTSVNVSFVYKFWKSVVLGGMMHNRLQFRLALVNDYRWLLWSSLGFRSDDRIVGYRCISMLIIWMRWIV